MICSKCFRDFNGIGNFCPTCQSSIDHESPSSQLQQKSLIRNAYQQTHGILPAGHIGRLIAWLFDNLTISILMNLIILPLLSSTLISLINNALLKIAFSSTGTLVISMLFGSLAGFILSILVVVLLSFFYYAIFESSPMQATPGKWLLGLIVTDINGNPISIFRSLGRVLMRYFGIVPILMAIIFTILFPNSDLGSINSSLMLLGMITLLITYPVFLFTSYRQGLHDLLSGCVVQEGEGTTGRGMLVALSCIITILGSFWYLHTTKGPAGFGKLDNDPISGILQQQIENFRRKVDSFSNKEIVISKQSQPEPNDNHPTASPATLPPRNDYSAKSIPELNVSMSVQVGGQTIKVENSVAMIDSTKTEVTLNFYSGKSDKNPPHFSVKLFFNQPIKSQCLVSELKKYVVNFNSGNGLFILPNDLDLISLTRVGRTPKGEIIALQCDLRDNKLNIKAFFSGESVYKNQTISPVKLTWNVTINEPLSVK